jgi:CBS-domain-containing membrane protein
MEEHQIRRLPILSREKRLIGVLSLGDIAIGTEDKEVAGASLKEVSEPTPTNQKPK